MSKSDADPPLSGLPAAKLLRLALICMGMPADTLTDPSVETLLASAEQHFDITRLARFDRLAWPT